ncbi:Os01g0961801 [Oryza sativa Japonica Group]|uniref:Os01g0961801 protein n=1 Tax=Oryza sativa subsp. japonica TaxID=39947 RepID=A0A0P0VD70_ORYSJ|nr:Os01g0961801 [Oryza sativa Japonica Group]
MDGDRRRRRRRPRMCSPGCGGSSRTNNSAPARSRDGWGSAQTAVEAEDVPTRMPRKQQDERRRPCPLAGWMGDGGGGGRTHD